jgi:hypothetical protein
MNFWRAMAARGEGCDGWVMSFPSFSNRAAGEGRPKMQCAFGSAKEDPIAGARSLSVLRRIGMTAELSAR